MATLFIKNLKLKAILGVHPWERQLKQSILINIQFQYDCSSAVNTDDLAHALDYDELTQSLETWVESSSFQLIETFAHALAEEIQKKTSYAFTLTVEKLHALSQADSVGIIISKDPS